MLADLILLATLVTVVTLAVTLAAARVTLWALERRAATLRDRGHALRRRLALGVPPEIRPGVRATIEAVDREAEQVEQDARGLRAALAWGRA